MTQRRSRFVVQVAALVTITCGVPIALSENAPEVAHPEWRDAILRLPTPHEGCFSASYPESVWHATTCWNISEHVHPVARIASAGESGETAGNGKDYVLSAPSGVISSATGNFPAVSGVTSETGTGVLNFGEGGILGANEYSLQINTNSTGRTSPCTSGSASCTVWQQSIYAPDYETKGSAAVFIQYWLLAYGSTCPAGWTADGASDCFKNSGYVAAPDVPITSLGSLKLQATATSGGNDTVTFTDGSTAYSVTASDSVLDIATAWKQAEFNVVGNAGGSQAVFNTGSSVTAKLAAQYGSTTAPSCVSGGTTGETNNLILQSCVAAGGTAPYIQFVESMLGPAPPVPTNIGIGFAEDCPSVNVQWTASTGATSYLVYTNNLGFAPPSPPTVASPRTTSTNSIILKGPGYDNYIYVWVASADSKGYSAWSSVASGKETWRECP